ncbi:MAG: sugar phosphate isomerase/epimerase family protein, partial [Candidatus Latescibacteria bacterium]|nr:sugar phosphate isomerase/epimerase family protein [Candidatus Latescibacterota bacterium]
MERFTIGILEDVLEASWEDVFGVAASLGYGGVELGIRADSYRESELWTEGGIDALARRARESGVPILSICLHTFWTHTFADPDAGNRTTAREIAGHVLGACQALGAEAVLIPVTNPLELPAEEAGELWAAETRALASDAAGYGVKIGLENVGRSHVVRGEELLQLVEDVDHPLVGVYFDVGNATTLGSEPLSDIRALASHIVQVHVKDPRLDRTPCYLGEGDVDLSGCLEALVEVDYRGPLVFETPVLDDPAGTAARNLDTLKGLIAQA